MVNEPSNNKFFIKYLQRKLLHLIIDDPHKPFLNHNSKFLMVTKNPSVKASFKPLMNLLPIINFAFLIEDANKIVLDRNNFDKTFYSADVDPFPDQIESLKHQTHEIFAIIQPPRVRIESGRLRSKMLHYLNIVAKLDNSKMNFKVMQRSDEGIKDLEYAILGRNFMLTLNILAVQNEVPKLLTYEANEFCPIAPIKENSIKEIHFKKVKSMGKVWNFLKFTFIST